MKDTLKVLIVDDDAVDRMAVRRALSDSPDGFQVHMEEAGDCAAAHVALSRGEYDCAFLDHRLPDGDGLALLRAMRAGGRTTPVIFLIGQGDEPLAVEAMRTGATDYLAKPNFSPASLSRCLQAAIRFQRAERQTRLAEEALRLRERAMAAASNGIVICDARQPDCPIIYCNPAFTAITGYSAEEALGRNCRFLQGPGTDAEYVEETRAALESERDCQVVLKNYRRDGSLWWNQLSISPVRDAGGRVSHFIGVQTDITERRRMEEALETATAHQWALLRDIFSSVTGGKLLLCQTEGDLPTPLPALMGQVSLTAPGGVRALRRQAEAAAAACGLSERRRDDLGAAVGEAAMNAVQHGTESEGEVRASGSGNQAKVQVRITDCGGGIAMDALPKATLERGWSTQGSFGHGFWIMLQSADKISLLTGRSGTTVVIEQNHAPPPPCWL
ncbi:MAG: PAS domain-containing protein [Armatimonadetes bacterium]|nr:PAS domain-containing protein [Armatimonadota bacterium]